MMQIEKAQINDRLGVLEVCQKIRIRTIQNFAVIRPFS